MFMKKSILFLAIFYFYSTFSNAQERTLGLLKYDSLSTDGYTLFSPISYNETYLIDNCGELVHKWTSDYNTGMWAYLLEDGSLLRAGRAEDVNLLSGGSGGIVEKFSWENELLWSYTFSDSISLSHHDIEPLPNGNFLVNLWVKADQDEIIDMGVNEDFINRSSGFWYERIIEIETVGLNEINIVWEWNIIDHLIQDLDPTKNNFGVVSSHPELLDINYPYKMLAGGDWLHFNSIDYNAELDQILISARNTGEIYIIDHSTTTEEAKTGKGGKYGKGGDILFRWGNPFVYKRGLETDQMLFGQHDPHWTRVDNPENDEIIIFNNGVGRETYFSSIDIIKVSHENGVYDSLEISQTYGPLFPIETIESDDFLNFSSPRVSGVQRLPNNNILICSGSAYSIFELDERRNLVWEYANPVSNFGPAPQFATIGGRDIFRAHKYPLDYEAFIGRNLVPSGPLEMDPIVNLCDSVTTAIHSIRKNESNPIIFPNPASEFIEIVNSSFHNLTFEFIDMNGKKVLSGHIVTEDRINLDTVNSGIYILKLTDKHSKFIQSYKIIKI